jgi:hypothetical protein
MNDDDDVLELEDPSDDSDGPPPLEYSSGDEGSDDVVGALVGALASVRLQARQALPLDGSAPVVSGMSRMRGRVEMVIVRALIVYFVVDQFREEEYADLVRIILADDFFAATRPVLHQAS